MQLKAKYSPIVLTLVQIFVPLLGTLTLNASPKFYSADTTWSRVAEKEEKVIVIDPGHGGKDPGCIAHHAYEKKIVLDIALKLKDYFEAKNPGIKVMLTRDSDHFVPLHERVKMANSRNNLLFVSLHCNSLNQKSAQGAESFVMGIHTEDENLELVKRENEVVLMEDLDSLDRNPYEIESHIMASIQQQQNLEKSIFLAAQIQEEIVNKSPFKDRGVKQAGFVVLRQVIVPSVLVEIGFLSNPKDADILKNEDHQERIALSIANGIEKYLELYTTNY